jgi:hypothetical protein
VLPTELHVYRGAFHSGTWLSQAGICQTILADLIDTLRLRLHAPVSGALEDVA